MSFMRTPKFRVADERHTGAMATCTATGILPTGEMLDCDHDQAPHPGVMHHDRRRGIWWGETDDGLMILGAEIPGGSEKP